MKVGNLSRVVAAVALTASLGMSSGCYATAQHGRVYVTVAPPAPVYEERVVEPGPGYVWVPGYYEWDGRAYVWVRGRYERPPRARAHWVPGHWERDRHGYYFVRGHWVR